MKCEKCGFSMLEWFLDLGKCPICDESIPASPFNPPEEKMVVRPDGIQLSKEGVIELMELEKIHPGYMKGKCFIINQEGLAEILKRKIKGLEEDK